jgi:hypothetical protein
LVPVCPASPQLAENGLAPETRTSGPGAYELAHATCGISNSNATHVNWISRFNPKAYLQVPRF